MAANKEDLFTRAAQAADKVTQLTADLKRGRENLKKARIEARSLYKQVLEALGKRPRQRKPRERVIATLPDVVLGEDQESNAESEYRRIKEQHQARPENTDER